MNCWVKPICCKNFWMIAILLSSILSSRLFAQQVKWAKVYPLEKMDKISCVVRDEFNIYAGGYTYRNAFYFNTTPYYKAILIKLDLNGDTIFIKDFGVSGEVMSMAVDPYGIIRANVKQYYFGLNGYNTFLFQIHPEGFILKTDTVVGNTPTSCLIGKDSSLIIVGRKGRAGFPGQSSMYFWRMNKYGVLDPWIELNPGHPNCVANRVEQLPNGHYLISGYVGSRVASYEVDSVGGNPVFHQWYQTPDFTNLYSGYAGRLGRKEWMIGAEGGPSFVGVYDSLKHKKWLKKEIGTLAPPQAMTDGSLVFGYNSQVLPYEYFYKFSSDSVLQWYFNVRDSVANRGIPGQVNVLNYTYFEDQSAVFAGTHRHDTGSPNDTKEDPFFIRISNVGTPVTSLSKPKRGPLKNETLAPWPNPTGGTLYLKQHFNQAEIRLYNLAGKEVGQYQIRFGQPIEISHLQSGVYLYRAVIDGKSYSGKVIRN